MNLLRDNAILKKGVRIQNKRFEVSQRVLYNYLIGYTFSQLAVRGVAEYVLETVRGDQDVEDPKSEDDFRIAEEESQHQLAQHQYEGLPQ
jgi:hypothetical protein